jgi:hypothetical protein
MNIGINLAGISSGKRSRNWNNTSQSIKDNIIDCWDSHTVNTYVTTYDHSTIPQLLEYYKPKKYNILNIEGSDQRLTYKSSLEMLQDQDLDFIISTRFDIEFFKSASSIGMDFNKFNILFPEIYENSTFVCDTFFSLPKKYLHPFIESVQYMYDNPARANCTDMHAISTVISDKIDGNIHIVSNEPELSNTNSFYTLHRE